MGFILINVGGLLAASAAYYWTCRAGISRVLSLGSFGIGWAVTSMALHVWTFHVLSSAQGGGTLLLAFLLSTCVPFGVAASLLADLELQGSPLGRRIVYATAFGLLVIPVGLYIFIYVGCLLGIDCS